MRILSLDWDSAYQRDLALELEAAGHQVELRVRVAEALASQAERAFDLVVCETRLPDKGGLQFLHELREVYADAAPPVVILTDVDEPEMRDRCVTEGVRRYLLKKDGWPATIAELHGIAAEIDPSPPGFVDGLPVPRPEPRVFRGNLETLEILDIIQLLNLGRKTGVLVLAGGVLDGRIVFEEGEIVAATNHDESGTSALGCLLTVKRGTFRFEAGSATVERTIHQPTSSLLLDVLRIEDETGRTSHTGAPGDGDGSFDFEHREREPEPGWLYVGVADAAPKPTDPSGRDHARHPGDSSSTLRPSERPALAPVEIRGPLEVPERAADPASGAPSEDSLGDPRPPSVQGESSMPWRFAAELAEAAPPSSGASPEAPSASVAPAPPTPLRRGPSLRRLTGVRRKLAVAGGATLVVLVSGYAAFFTDLVRRQPEVVQSADYRRLILEAAANQAKIDSLEQVVVELTTSVQSGDVSRTEAAPRLTALKSEIEKASADLEVARKAADAKLEAAPGAEDSRAESAPPAGGAPEARRATPADDAAAGGDLSAADTRVDSLSTVAPAEPGAADAAEVEVVPVEVAPTAGAPPASALARAGARVPESAAPVAAAVPDYGLAAIRRAPTFVPVDTRPSPRTPLRPRYPPALADRKIGGTVTLWTLVDADGRVADVRVLRSSGQPELDKAALDAIRSTVYRPARRDGAAVPAWTQQQIAFKLE